MNFVLSTVTRPLFSAAFLFSRPAATFGINIQVVQDTDCLVVGPVLKSKGGGGKSDKGDTKLTQK